MKEASQNFVRKLYRQSKPGKVETKIEKEKRHFDKLTDAELFAIA